jgi:hypothetical protein
MTGYEDWNFPAFHAAAKAWREMGWQVVNPAETDDGDTSKPWDYYMRKDIAHVLTVDAVAVLPGWEKSKGATLEVTIAKELGLKLYDALTFGMLSSTVLERAQQLVFGARQDDYGHPADDFGRTADFWTVRFRHKLKDGERFTADDVPPAMRLVKESRLVNSPRHRDSIVDIAGYCGTQELVWQREAEDG